MYGHSFRQPDDVNAVPDEDEEGGGSDTEAINEEPPAVDIPRSMAQDAEPLEAQDVGDIPGENTVTPSRSEDLEETEETVRLQTGQGKEPRALGKSGESLSFATAAESSQDRYGPRESAPADCLSPSHDSDKKLVEIQKALPASGGSQPPRVSIAGSSTGKGSLVNVEPSTPADASESMVSLLPHDHQHRKNKKDTKASHSTSTIPIVQQPNLQTKIPEQVLDDVNMEPGKQRGRDRIPSGLVKFNISEEVANNEARMKLRLAHISRRRSLRSFRRGKSRPGEIVKMERMLIRVDSTMQTLPDDYDENDSLKTESRTVEKWREYVVVCRESTAEDVEFSLQMYKSRVSGLMPN